MKRDEILNTFKMLAQSQGFYGRILQSLEEADNRDEILDKLEEMNFQDPVDLILFIEG